MILHLVTFTFRPDAPRQLADEFYTDLAAMRQRLGDSLLDYQHGPALRLRTPSADYAVAATVRDETDLHQYLDDPGHRRISERYAVDLFTARSAVQIEVLREFGHGC